MSLSYLNSVPYMEARGRAPIRLTQHTTPPRLADQHDCPTNKTVNSSRGEKVQFSRTHPHSRAGRHPFGGEVTTLSARLIRLDQVTALVWRMSTASGTVRSVVSPPFRGAACRRGRRPAHRRRAAPAAKSE